MKYGAYYLTSIRKKPSKQNYACFYSLFTVLVLVESHISKYKAKALKEIEIDSINQSLSINLESKTLKKGDVGKNIKKREIKSKIKNLKFK